MVDRFIALILLTFIALILLELTVSLQVSV